MRDIPVIKCPVCGTQYLPSEVLYPDSVFGKQYDIIRKNTGEIEAYLGTDPELDEEFVCDSCLTKLKINVKMSFEVEPVKEETFEEEYITHINKPKKITLNEEELF